MTATVLSFYIISAFILTGGLLAVTATKIFRSAVWLLMSLTGIAALYFWMDLQFLAAVQVVVYIGGIVVLIIFSILIAIMVLITHQKNIERLLRKEESKAKLIKKKEKPSEIKDDPE